VFRIFVDKARRGEPITIQGSGLQERQFTHVSDLAGAFSSACGSDLHGVINVVASEKITIKQLAEAVVARYPTEITFGDPRPGDAPPAMVSAKKAHQLLGWEPLIGFEEGVAGLMDDLEGGG
jgi:UDP-glucose 4-epimerase